MAILPTRTTEIEFDAGIWTDISADVAQTSTRRGRNRESGAFETGSATIIVRNDTRKYDPDNTAGPYYGKLRPNRRIRFRATYSAVTYPVIQGYINRWTQVYGGPNDAAAQIDASDLFKILNQAELISSAYAAEVLTDAPNLWWRLGDPAGSTAASEHVTGTYPLGLVGVPAFGATSLAVRESDTAVSFPTTGDGLNGVFPAGTFPLTTTGTVEFLVQAPISATNNYVFVAATMGATNRSGYQIQRDVGEIVQIFLVNNAGTVFNVATTVPILDGITHHVAITFTAGSPIKVYVDGVDRTSAAVNFTGTMANTTDPWIVATGQVSYPPFILSGFVGVIDELALYTTALSAARVTAHNSAARTPWTGDLPGARLGRILDLAAVPTADRNIDTGSTVLQSTSLGGSALAYAQKVEETDLGELFVTRDGKIRYISRDNLYTGTYLTSQATLVDDDAGAGVPYLNGGSADVDGSIIVTRSTVSRDGSIAVTYYDAAAKTEFGWLDDTHDGLLHASDAYSLAYAQWIVNTHNTPATRIGALDLALAKDPPTMYPAILALELGDRVTYKRKPQNLGAVISIDMRVQSIAHDTGPGYWRTKLELSPINLAAGGAPVGVWDVSLWDQSVWGI